MSFLESSISVSVQQTPQFEQSINAESTIGIFVLLSEGSVLGGVFEEI